MGLKLIIQNVFNRFGYQVQKQKKDIKNTTIYQKDELINNLFLVFLTLGFKPKNIVDIGAHKGGWTRLFLNVFPECNVLMIEPQMELSESFNDLKELPNIDYLPIGVGEKSGELKFTMHDRADSCSFQYTPEEANRLGLLQKCIEVRSLNDIYQDCGLANYPELVKIDAEGLDLEVLRGASNLFGYTEVFLVEATVFSKLYKNSVLKVVDYMNKCGYELFDITDMNRPFDVKVLWLVELVFVKKNGYFSKAFNSDL